MKTTHNLLRGLVSWEEPGAVVEVEGATILLGAGDMPSVDNSDDRALTCDCPRTGDESGVTAE